MKKTLFVRGKESIPIPEIRLLAAGEKEYIQSLALPVKEGDELELQVVEPHLNNPLDGIARVEGYIIDIESAGRMVGKQVKVRIEKMFKTYAKGVLCD